MTHEIRLTPTEPRGAQGLELPDSNSGDRGSKGTHEGPEAASHRTEPGEKTQMSPSGLCPTRSEAHRVISTFLFDPNLEPYPHNLHRGEASGPPRSVSGMT